MDEMTLAHLDAERSARAMLAVARYYIRSQPHTCEEDPDICCAVCVAEEVVEAGTTGVSPLWAQDGD